MVACITRSQSLLDISSILKFSFTGKPHGLEIFKPDVYLLLDIMFTQTGIIATTPVIKTKLKGLNFPKERKLRRKWQQ
jgi:hypothetical protein